MVSGAQHCSHGSVHRICITDRSSSESRQLVEAQLKTGEIDCVVATSALDLGVDFQAVERIIQVGSPRSVSRLIQRAGRASHRPGAGTDVVLAPTNRLHLNEYAALADALDHQSLEPIRPPEHCLDVLIQHLVTMALQAPWHPDAMFPEIQASWGLSSTSQRTPLIDYSLCLSEALSHSKNIPSTGVLNNATMATSSWCPSRQPGAIE